MVNESTSAVTPNDEETSVVSADWAGHSGHRSRLLDRFDKNGISSLHDHEILELLLTYAIPRKDTKPIARSLLKKYKSVSGVINAPVNELVEIDGIGKRTALLFPLIKDILSYCLKERYSRGCAIAKRKDVEEFLRFTFGHRRDEYVAVLFLDNANHVLETQIIAEGTVNQCAVYPRLVFDRALKVGAASFILAHNHPGGSTNPSDADWNITERLLLIGRHLEIPILDHLIIVQEKVVSLRDFARWPK